MKVRDTSPGRLYALSSEIGCVAINGAMAVDIPAGGQVVVLALDKKIVIDGDDDAKFVEVRWGTNTVVGSRPVPAWLSDVLSGLISIVGDDNFDINYIPAENKLYLQFSLVTAEQLEDVRTLLDRVIPQNLVTEIEYYKPLEWLYASIGPYIDTGVIHAADIGMTYEVERTQKADSYLCGVSTADGKKSSNPARYVPGISFTGSYPGTLIDWGWCPADLPLAKTVHSLNFLNNKKLELRNEYLSKESNLNAMTEGLTWKSWTLFTIHVPISQWSGRGRICWAKFSRDNEIIAHFVPALDPTGAPCMFDLVSKQPFYNSGTGDFTYPAQEQAVQTLDLDWDAKAYAKFTEHGVRRLYHVPEGYNGTKDDYAAENGFKELVEPPMPLEGYWIPEWRETDTQLILDWVETEPPAEEELQIEDTENA